MSYRVHWLAMATSLLVLLTVASPASAAGPEYKNFWTVPFSEVDESCSGELVEVTGTLRHHVVFVNDGRGGFHGNGIFVGTASGTSEGGTRYVAGFTDQLSQYFAPGDGGSVGSGPFSFRLISTDSSENLLDRPPTFKPSTDAEALSRDSAASRARTDPSVARGVQTCEAAKPG